MEWKDCTNLGHAIVNDICKRASHSKNGWQSVADDFRLIEFWIRLLY